MNQLKKNFFYKLKDALDSAKKKVELRGDDKACSTMSMNKATEEDWGKEYLDYILSVKTVSDIDEAMHISINTIQDIQMQS